MIIFAVKVNIFCFTNFFFFSIKVFFLFVLVFFSFCFQQSHVKSWNHIRNIIISLKRCIKIYSQIISLRKISLDFWYVIMKIVFFCSLFVARLKKLPQIANFFFRREKKKEKKKESKKYFGRNCFLFFC